MTVQARSITGRLRAPSAAATSRLVTGLCWFALFSEGYDMGALGAVLPSMMADPAWRLAPALAGMIASAALVGMFFGGYLFGVVGDRYGRKPAFITCLTLFSLASGCAALAPTPAIFALWRCLAGVGIGGIVPLAAALTCEYAPPGRENRQFALMYTGYSIGIFASAAASFLLVADHGWRLVIGLGAAPLAFVPLVAWRLPESIAFLRYKSRTREAELLAARLGVPPPTASTVQLEAPAISPGLGELLSHGRARATLGFWFATFFGMILVYGLNTWLPQIMRSSGYELGPSIMFLGVFALASSGGGVLLGALADRLGRARTITAAFAFGAAAIMLLAHVWPLPVTYAIVAAAGVGSVAAAVIVTSFLASYFPPELRATAVGCCLSVSRFGAVCGPLIGGFIAQSRLDIACNFAAFALAALAAAASIRLVPREAPGRPIHATVGAH
ncbi:MFS transporter [Phenylobacterium sp. LjRoot225]|uniref:MFS transporter n=1 Tax=Phenylobacterium sp. LjRoot225 TaxID=3342285 RepID=UPI003ECC5608